MTAEVAIMNRSAVALAADSAMTVDGPRGTKIYNTVNKLFTLSKTEPVGIMVFSRAEVMGMPAETVVKWFRKGLGTTAHKHLPDYSDAFLRFLIEDQEVFPLEARISQCRDVLAAVLQHIAGVVYPKPDADEQAEATRIIQELHASILASNELAGATKEVRGKLHADLSELINAYKTYFEEGFQVQQDTLDLLDEIAVEFFMRDGEAVVDGLHVLGLETGFVIAGFGLADFMPRLRSFEFVSSIYEVTKVWPSEETDITFQNKGAIVPFAQKDMIETFVEGRARSFDSKLGQFLASWFDGEIAKLDGVSNLDPESKDAISAAMTGMREQVLESVANQLAEWTREQHIHPLVDTVSVLPKEELAVMAEALINLTIHKRRASLDAETVGPPTDVAVISKGDGFIWIKRKHYFDPELNPHFGHNYFQGMQS